MLVKDETINILDVATRRLASFAIFFTASAFVIESVQHIIKPHKTLVFFEGAIALINIALTALLFFNKISTRKATIWLIYPVIINMVTVYFVEINNINIGSMVLRDMLYSLLLVFLASHALNRIHNIVICVLFSGVVVVATFVSKNSYLITNLASILIILVGGWITVNAFGRLLNSTFQKYLVSQRKVEELHSYKHNLVSHIIHDLKVPVNSILDLSNNNTDSILTRINSSANELNKQITTILDVEKLENTEVELNTQSVDLEQLVKQSVKSVEVLAHNKHIAINTQFKVNGLLKCDKDLIHRVMVNLLSNAIKYSSANSCVAIEISACREGAKVAFIDNGKGIKTEYQDKIFDKFFHIQTDELSNKTSNGLGLTFCKLAMQAHNGSITVVSEYGKGARFELVFPDFVELELERNKVATVQNGFNLTSKEKDYIAEIGPRLEATAIYKIGEIAELLLPYTNSKNKNIQHWAEHVLQAAYSGDYENYRFRLNMGMN